LCWDKCLSRDVYALNDIVKICVYYYYYILFGPCMLYDYKIRTQPFLSAFWGKSVTSNVIRCVH